ncbi:hypothetical protein [Streptomyces lasiicapitis]|uniref:Uncharacterized protein n=1 Tax=Streptomyces lasiicapitis TaxID=1923961 RepID=A0ABQ2MY37_9ACTN|nr:hypothetical protein [Streptomyces lasiicapitis]GGO60116.1 hypothetical protein GCM10012286_83270 [Streptomyces lasiicapitis]
MITLAASTEIQPGQVLGALGSGGAALACTLLLIAGCKGKGSIEFSRVPAAGVGYVAGLLYMMAGAGIWTAPGSVSASVSQSLQGGWVGDVGPAAAPLCLVILVYGFKLSPGFSGVCGIVAATAFHVAGGIWSVPEAIASGFLNNALGVH